MSTASKPLLEGGRAERPPANLWIKYSRSQVGYHWIMWQLSSRENMWYSLPWLSSCFKERATMLGGWWNINRTLQRAFQCVAPQRDGDGQFSRRLTISLVMLDVSK